MTNLYASDPDVHQTYPITAKQGDLSFTPIVQVTNMPGTEIVGEWLGAAGLSRDLKVPLAGLPAGTMLFLRLVVPDENDVELGYVVLESNTDYGDFEPAAVEAASAYAAEAKGYRDELAGLEAVASSLAPRVTTVEQELDGRLSESGLSATYATVGRQVGGITTPRVSGTATIFAAGHGFTNLSGTLLSVADDTTTHAVGTQSLAVTTKTDGSAGSAQNLALATPINATGKDLVVTLRVESTTNLTGLILYATSDSMANYYQWTIQDNGLEAQRILKSGEWQTITLSFADAFVSGTPNRAALNGFRMRAQCSAGNNTTVRWNRIAATPQASSAVVSICVDDIYESTYTILRPILDKYGFGATCYAIPERATDALVNVTELHRLEDVNGWEIAAHGLTDLTTMSVADAEADLIASRTWLIENGFKGIDHYAYPQGGFSPAVETLMRRLYRSGRTIVSRTVQETQPPANPYRLRSRSVSNTTPAATVTAEITKAKAEKSWYILTLHDITAGAASLGTQYAAADLETICAHIAAEGIAVKTVGDVLAGM